MKSTGRHIDRFTHLAEWYDCHSAATRRSGHHAEDDRHLEGSAIATNRDGFSASTQLLLAVCEALPAENRDHILSLINGVSSFVKFSTDPLQDFLAADQILAADELTLAGVISQITEHGIGLGLGTSIQDCITGLADVTPLSALRFLSGWVALNNSDYARCIDECEKISEPFAAVYALIGQASLELGEISDATEALHIATTLDPGEPMSWFQLAKAHHVAGDQSKAWDALDHVEELTGPDLEVSSMRAFVALAASDNHTRLDKAWLGLVGMADPGKTPPSLATLLLELSFARTDLEGTRLVIESLNPNAAAQDRDFVANLPRVLRRLNEWGRMDLAATLLERVVPQKSYENKKGA